MRLFIAIIGPTYTFLDVGILYRMCCLKAAVLSIGEDTNEHVRDERVLTNYCEGNEAIPGLRLVKVHPASVSREHIIRLFVLWILATSNPSP